MDQQPTTGPGPTTLQPGPQLIPNWVSGGVYTPYTQPPRQILVKAPDTFERQLNVSALNEPCRVTFGRDRIGAQILHALNYNGKLLVVCHYGRGVVQEIESFTVSDVTAASVTATHYLGTTSQTVDAKLVTAFAALGITHSTAMTGHVYGVYEFPVGSSIGDIHIVLKGLKLYDSRDGAQSWASPSTYVYTDNPAVCLANAIANTTWGLGAAFDWAGSEDAFDACDDMTSGEKKRLIGLTLDRRLSAHEWCEILRAHAGCFIVRSNGQYKLVPDAPASSVRTFSKANKDIIKGSLRWQRTGLDQQPNVVEFTYTDTSVIPWKTATAIYPANGIPPGSEELRLARIDLPGCQRYSQAMREVHERRNHARIEGLLFTFDTFADAIAQEPGDVCTLDDDNMFAGIDFRLLDKSMKRKGRFTITGKKYDVASYNNSMEADPTYEDTTLASPTSPPTVTGLVLTEIVEAPGTGGTPRSSIACTWDSLAATYPFLTGYRVYVLDDSGETQDEGEPIGNTWTSRPLPAPQRYRVFVKAKSSIATATGYDTETITLSGSTTSLTLVSSTPILRAGATFSNFDYYTLYPGDPYLRVSKSHGISFASQYATDPISDAIAPETVLNFGISADVYINKNTNYVTTDPVDLGIERNMTVAVNLAAPVDGLVTVQAAPTASGPWTTIESLVGQLYGRWVRARITVSDQPFVTTLPDGSAVSTITPGPWLFQQDLAGATLEVYGATLEETGEATSSASGPVTVTLAGHYAALRDLQVTPLQSAGTAVVTAGTPSLSLVADNTFEVNITVAGARVAVPVRWNFKGAA